MSAKRRLLIACALTTIFYHLPAYSSLEYKGSFGLINAGYADWNSGFINTHRGEVWKVTADFGVNFKEAEFYSFYESNVLNHAVAGRNPSVSPAKFSSYTLCASRVTGPLSLVKITIVLSSSPIALILSSTFPTCASR